MMNMIDLRNNIIASIGTILLLLSCTPVNDAGGGSSTGNANRIAGVCVEPDGTTPASCGVYLYRAEGMPVAGKAADTAIVSRTSTDSEGRYALADIPDGTYNLFFDDTVSSYSKLIVNKSISGNDSMYVGIDTLRFTASLSGRVENRNGLPAIAFIYGSPFFTSVNDTSGYFFMHDLPSGDSLTITFTASRPQSNINCLARYQFNQLPDTTMFITVVLECE